MMLEAISLSSTYAIAFLLIVIRVCGRVAQSQRSRVVVGIFESSLLGRAVQRGSRTFALTLFVSPEQMLLRRDFVEGAKL
jgi:hypothetical protein